MLDYSLDNTNSNLYFKPEVKCVVEMFAKNTALLPQGIVLQVLMSIFKKII